jgi:hypothetical protein
LWTRVDRGQRHVQGRFERLACGGADDLGPAIGQQLECLLDGHADEAREPGGKARVLEQISRIAQRGRVLGRQRDELCPIHTFSVLSLARVAANHRSLTSS